MPHGDMDSDRTEQDLKQRIALVLDLARARGASQAEASASFGSGLSTTVRMRDVETLEYHRDQGLGLTVWFDGRKGSASTSDLSEAAITESVDKACSLARYAAPDPDSGLADAERMASIFPDLDLEHPWGVQPAEAMEIATACEAAALAVSERITNSEGASVSTHAACRAYGNTHGFLAASRSTQHSLSCAVLAGDGQTMERDYEYSVARDAGELAPAEEIGRAAAGRALARLGAEKLTTRQVPVLFPARLARGLIGHLLGAIAGGALYRKASFLLDARGKPVFADHVSIVERPHLPRALASAAYDDEGVATADRDLVSGGVLQGYVLGSYYARKLGLETTGNAGGTHNLVVSDTGQDFDALLREMGNGFLVTELMGHGVNTVNGDYSRGAAGFVVENGAIGRPVHEVTIAGNLAEVYRRIVAIGTDTDCRGGIRTGSILAEGLTVAGS